MPQSGQRYSDLRRSRGAQLRLGVVSAVTLAPILVAACGGEDVPEDERARQINGVAELATNAYAAAGAEGLYDYLSQDIVAECSKEGLVKALEVEPVPDGFKSVSNVEFNGPQARVDVVQLFGEEERTVEWSFVLENEDSWRLTHLPGLEACEN